MAGKGTYVNSAQSQVEVQFANYTSSFNYFFQEYKNMCIEVSEAKNIKDLFTRVYSFMSEFSYGVPLESDKQKYDTQMIAVKEEMLKDKLLIRFLGLTQDRLTRSDEYEYLKRYYYYFNKIMSVLASFSETLTATLMPNLNVQKKLLRFYNSNMFFEKLSEYKRQMLQELSKFDINDFRVPLNMFITFYYAYKLFITEKDRILTEEVIQLSLDLLLSEDTLDLLKRFPKLYGDEMVDLYDCENLIHSCLMYCNSVINSSLSEFGILPKINHKKYIDTTGI